MIYFHECNLHYVHLTVEITLRIASVDKFVERANVENCTHICRRVEVINVM